MAIISYVPADPNVGMPPYGAWYATEEGTFALARKEELLSRLLSGWGRRSRKLLVVQAGEGFFLEKLWDAGFDVTGQEHDPSLVGVAKKRMGTRAEVELAAPEHLPFEVDEFDYAVLVDALETLANPAAVLQEVNRVTCSGLIIIVPNAWSLLNLSCRLAGQKTPLHVIRQYLQNPYILRKLMLENCDAGVFSCESNLMLPVCAWQNTPPFRRLNSLRMVLPFGSLLGYRLDFGPSYASPPLFASGRESTSATNETMSASSVRSIEVFKFN